jgi:hypothetical protein
MYRRYRELFTNRYQPPFHSFSLVHLCDLLIRYGDRSKIQDVIQFCLETLSEALPGFPIIGPLQAMFCESVLLCGYKLPANVEQMMGGRSWQSFSREEKLDCCERLTYLQPNDMLAERLDQDIGSNFEEEWKAFIESHGSDDATEAYASGSAHDSDEQHTSTDGSKRQMDINAVMNLER